MLDTKSGLVEFVIECSPDGVASHAKVFMQQMELTSKAALSAEQIESLKASLGQEFEKTFEPSVVSTGLFDLQVAIAQEEKL